MIRRLSLRSYDHPVIAVFTWLILLAMAVVGSGLLGSAFSTSVRLPGSDSDAAYQVLQAHWPNSSVDSGLMVVHTRAALAEPRTRASVVKLLHTVSAVKHVDVVGAPMYSADARTVAYSLDLPAASAKNPDGTLQVDSAVHSLERAAVTARAQGLHVEFSGSSFVTGGVPANAELIGLVVAVVVLLLVLGSLLAAGVALLPALLGVLASTSLVTALTHVLATPDVTTTVATMIGLGVGIDYCLFIVARFRRELEHREPRDAFAATAATAVRAVTVAGSVVAIALLGMVLMNMDFLRGVAVGAAMAVLTALALSVTFLPALLHWSSRRMKRQVHRRAQRLARVTIADRWSRVVVRRPRVVLLVGLIVTLVLALPVSSIHLAYPDASSDHTNTTTYRAQAMLAQAFGPGTTAPLVVVAKGRNEAALADVARSAEALPNVARVSPVERSADGLAASFTVTPMTSAESARTERLVAQLRHDISRRGLVAHVGGMTATSIDFAEAMRQRLVYLIGAVLAASFILLLLVFRSITIALQALCFNLLSITAAFGLLVVVFQWGWLASAFHLPGGAPIAPWIPVFLFAIVFGLSMDYQVFLLSAIRERFSESGDTNDSVAHGLRITARLITGAAAIMTAVFASFAGSQLQVVQVIGFGLAAAVLIDATLIRMMLVPACMVLVGRWNWWLPRWLDRALPGVHVEHLERPAAQHLLSVTD